MIASGAEPPTPPAVRSALVARPTSLLKRLLVGRPARNHAIVLVSKVHLPTLRALAYARATRPEPGVMVTSVPWQLASTAAKDLDRLDRDLARGPARGPRERTPPQ